MNREGYFELLIVRTNVFKVLAILRTCVVKLIEQSIIYTINRYARTLPRLQILKCVLKRNTLTLS